MSETSSTEDLPRLFAALEERMKTMQAGYKTDIAMLAADNATRDNQQLLANAGIVGLATAILSVLIGVLALT